MAILKIIVMRDIKANTYHAPMFVPNVNVAMRDLQDMINEPPNPQGQRQDWQRHPEDFELWNIGEYDTDNGTMDLATRSQVVHLSALKA